MWNDNSTVTYEHAGHTKCSSLSFVLLKSQMIMKNSFTCIYSIILHGCDKVFQKLRSSVACLTKDAAIWALDEGKLYQTRTHCTEHASCCAAFSVGYEYQH